MQFPFNAYDYDPTQGGSICFPLADYKLEITGAKLTPTKNDPTHSGYLELDLTVLEGDLRGLIQKDRLNLYNPSETVRRIAHQTLSAYCFAINRPYIQDTDQLLGGRLIATIGPQGDNSKYSEVKQIKCMDGTTPTRPQQQQGQAAPPQAPQQAPQAPPQAPPQPQAPPPMSQGQYPVASGPGAPPWNQQPAPAPAAPVPAPSWAGGPQAPPPPPQAGNAQGLPPWAQQR